MRRLTHGSLFAGFGGFDLGFERAGMITKWQVEIGDYPSRVLAKHWPDVPRFRDVRDCGVANLAPVDIISGGFPCQPFSSAGKRRGESDDRFLWPEMLRIIAELRPAWVVAENVPGLAGMALERVLADLEAAAYGTGTIEIPACGIDAPHRRYRLFIVARHADRQQQNSQCAISPANVELARIRETVSDADRAREQQSARLLAEQRGRPGDGAARPVAADVGRDGHALRGNGRGEDGPSEEVRISAALAAIIGCAGATWPAEPDVVRMVHGISSRMERAIIRERIAGLGNAVVPQVVEVIGRFIIAAEEMHSA